MTSVGTKKSAKNKTGTLPDKKRTIPLLQAMIGIILAVMLWRGCWWALDTYFFPDNLLLSNMLCLLIPLFIGTVWAFWAGYQFSWAVDPPATIWK